MMLVSVLLTGFLLVCCHGIDRWDVFNTKTIYRWSHNVTAVTDEDYSFPYGQTTCKAIHVNMVVRHGARWPSDGDMEDIKAFYKKISESKPSSAYPELNSWTPRYDLANQKELVNEGKIEQQEFGGRLGLRFKSLFDNNGKYVKFISSSTSRTRDSSTYFHRGMSSSINTLPELVNEVKDNLVRYYDDCDIYEPTVESDENLKEYTQFSNSQIFKNVADAVKSRLNLTFNMNEDEVTIVYELCAFEKYIFNETSVWCDLLTDNERLMMAYRGDLEDYYEASYGHPLNSKVACPLVSDMFHTMDRAINNTWNYDNLPNVTNYGYLAGKFYNGHSDTLIPLLTSLGLYKDDEPLLATNMDRMANRKFKIGTLFPTTANIGFVVYACDDAVTTSRSFKVKLFVNEKSVEIPACSSDICTYSTVRSYYSELIDRCNYDCMCKNEEDSVTCKSSVFKGSLYIVELLSLISFAKLYAFM